MRRDQARPQAAAAAVDPIFQGLAISLMAGEVASLLLSLATVPVLYYLSHARRPVAVVRAEAA